MITFVIHALIARSHRVLVALSRSILPIRMKTIVFLQKMVPPWSYRIV